MPGLGQAALPRPSFSENNPYWTNPSKFWGWLAPEMRPKLTAEHYLYATYWELYAFNIHSAYRVRMAITITMKIMRGIHLRDSFKNLRSKQKENQVNEKAV